MPEPCGYCGKCDWSAACEARWTEADHLCRVADITRKQTTRLQEAGVSTLSMLASLDGVRVAGIKPETLARLVQQARLQKESAAINAGVHQTLAHVRGFGFDRLPLPDPHDLFFDFEGDPMHPGGLEYLRGVLWRASSGDVDGEPVPRPSRAALSFFLGPRSRAGEERVRRADGLPDASSRPCARSPPLPLRTL